MRTREFFTDTLLMGFSRRVCADRKYQQSWPQLRADNELLLRRPLAASTLTLTQPAVSEDGRTSPKLSNPLGIHQEGKSTRATTPNFRPVAWRHQRVSAAPSASTCSSTNNTPVVEGAWGHRDRAQTEPMPINPTSQLQVGDSGLGAVAPQRSSHGCLAVPRPLT